MRDFLFEWLMPSLIAVVTVLLVMSAVTDAKPTPAPSCSQLWEDLRENAKSINLLEDLCFDIENADDKYNCYESVYRYKREWLQTTKEYNLVCPENK
jgi:hypothetical protein